MPSIEQLRTDNENLINPVGTTNGIRAVSHRQMNTAMIDKMQEHESSINDANIQILSISDKVDTLSVGQLNATPTSTPTTGINVYNVREAGTYTNFGGLVVTDEDLEDGQVQLWLTDGVWSKEVIEIPTDVIRESGLDLVHSSINIVNPSYFMDGYTITDSTGDITNVGATAAQRVVALMPKVEDYTVNYTRTERVPVAARAVYMYNDSMSYLGKAELSTDGKTFQLSRLCKFFAQIVSLAPSDWQADKEAFMVERGSIQSAYEPYLNELSGIDGLSIDERPTFTEITEGNYFNEETLEIGSFLGSGGTILAGITSDRSRTPYFEVKVGDIFTASGWASLTNKYIGFVSDSGTVSGLQATTDPFTWTSTINGWMSVNVKHTSDPDNGNLIINKGTSATVSESKDVITKIDEKYVKADSLNAGAMIGSELVGTASNILPKVFPLTVLYDNNLFHVRTSYDNEYDLVQIFTLAFDSLNNPNTSFDYYPSRLVLKSTPNTIAGYATGFGISCGRDDTAPFACAANSGHIAEGHGLNSPRATASGHGKTTADVGSLWLASNGREYYIQAILSTSSIQFYSKPFDGGVAGELSTTNSMPTGTLTHVSGAVNTANINVTVVVTEAISPLHSNRTQKVFIDEKEITSFGLYYGENLNVINEYDLVDPSQITIANPLNPSVGTTFIRCMNVYQFQGSGAHVFYWTGNPQVDKMMNYFYGMQTVKMLVGTNYDKVFHMLPESLPVSGRDFSVPYDVTTDPPQTDFLRSHRVRDAYPINTHVQFLQKDGLMKEGFAIGFNDTLGLTERTFATSRTIDWQIASTAKSYPRVIVNRKIGLDLIQFEGHRVNFPADLCKDALFCYSWRDCEGRHRIRLGVTGAITKGIAWGNIQHLIGRKIEVHVSNNITLLADMISSSGIHFSSTGKGTIELVTV